jgi:hypothetical protein
MSINLTNSVDLIVNSLSVIKGNNIEDISEIFLSKDEAISGIVGLPVSTLDTLEKIGASIDNDPNFFVNNQISLDQKSDLTYVNGQLLLKKDLASYNTEKDIITNTFNDYQSIASNTTLLNAKANQATTHTKTEDTAFLNAKANQATTYTKTEIDTIFETLIDSAPIALDQLSELAAALDNDANYASNVNNLIATKAAQASTYTKTENDSLLNAKANQTTTYTKAEDNTLLNAKANQATTYTKTEDNALLNAKANQATTYTKTEADTLVTSVLRTGATSVSLKNNSNEDVAIFYNTKDIEMKGAAYIYGGMSVLGASVLAGVTNVGVSQSDTFYALGHSTVTSTLSVLGKVRTNEIIGAGADQITIADSVTIDYDLRVNGEIYLNSTTQIYTPFMYAGKINGATLGIMKSAGRKDFTVTRASGYATGIFKISFSEPMPDTNYIITMAVQRWANFVISWDSRPPTVNDFHIVVYNTSNTLENSVFFFNIM